MTNTRTVRHKHFYWLLVMLVPISIISSCKTLHNRINLTQLDCSGPVGTQDYFVVLSPDGRRLTNSEFTVVDLARKSDPDLSTPNGCVIKRSQGKILIRSNSKNWAGIYDFSSDSNKKSLTLSEFADDSIAINCSEKTIYSANRNLKLSDLILTTVPEHLRDGVDFQWWLNNGGATTSSFKSLEIVKPLSNSSDGEKLDLNIRVISLLRDQKANDYSCHFNIDLTSPDVELVSATSQSIKWKEIQNLQAVDSDERLSFRSKSEDIGEIQYCAQSMTEPTQANKLLNNDSLVELNNEVCAGPISRTIPGEPILGDKRKGLWSILFYAKDKLGNQSIVRRQNIMFVDKGKIAEIKKIAAIDSKDALNEGRQNEVARLAVRGASELDNLATEYEKSLVRFEVQIALKRILDLKSIAIPLKGHQREINYIGFSNDGTKVVSISGDSKIVFRRSSDGEPLSESYFSSTLQRYRVSKSKTDLLLVELISDINDLGPVKYWIINFKDFKINERQIPFKNGVISPSGEIIGFQDSAGKLQQRDRESNREVNSNVTLSGGKFLGYGQSDDEALFTFENGEVALVELETSLIKLKFDGLQSSSTLFSLSPNSKFFAAATDTGFINVWDCSSGRLVRSYSTGARVLFLSLSDQNEVAAGMSDGRVFKSKFDTSSNEPIFSFDSKMLPANGAVATDQSRFVLTNSKETHSAYLNRTIDRTLANILPLTSTISPTAVTYATPQNVLRYANGNGTIYTWSESLGKVQTSNGSPKNQFIQPKILGGGAQFFGAMGSSIYRLELNGQGKYEAIYALPDNIPIQAFNLTADLSRLMIATKNKLYVVDIVSKKVVQTSAIEDNSIGLIEPDQENKLFYTASLKKGFVKSWHLTNLSQSQTLQAHDQRVLTLNLNSDLGLLVSGSADKTAKVWNVRTNRLEHTLNAPYWVTASRISPNNRLLVTSSRNNYATYWDLETGAKIHETNKTSANEIAFDSTGNRIVYAYEDAGLVVESIDVRDMHRSICLSLNDLFPAAYCSSVIK